MASPLSFSDRKVIRKSEFVNRGGKTNMLFIQWDESLANRSHITDKLEYRFLM